MRSVPTFLRAGMIALVLALNGAGLAFPTVGTAQAQTEPAAEAIDYTEWESVATRAEESTANARASDEAFATLRAELVTWRGRFLAVQAVNRSRIETVNAQIAALGAAPADGETEPPEVATRRRDLRARLAGLQVPGVAAVEAYQRAEGLIREIDQIVRDRQTAALLQREPMPLNPVNWSPAISHLAQTATAIKLELQNNWTRASLRQTQGDDLPAILGLLMVAGVLLLRGRIWMERLAARTFERFGSELAGLFVSTGQVIAPTLGIFLLVRAVDLTGLLGPRGGALLGAAPTLVLAYYGARWIASRIFPRTAREPLILVPMSYEERRGMRWLAGTLGLVIGLASMAAALGEQENYGAEIGTVLYFPFIVLTGLLLFRFGQTLRRLVRAYAATPRVGIFQASILAWLGRVTMLVGVVGTLLAATGYSAAAHNSIYPTAQTLALLGFVVILNRLIADLHMLLTGSTPDETREALIPTLVSFAIALTALPILALIWGARVTDLAELWTQLSTGFAIGETRISPADFLTFAVVFAIGYVLTRLVQNALKVAVLPKTRIDPGGRNAITSGVGYIGVFLAAIIAITSAGIDLSNLALVAGALSVGIGFGLQNIVSNFVSGIILLVERPIGEGDWIEVGPNMGIVKSISVRSTRIETFDKTELIVPNADFVSGTVTNWTRGNLTGRAFISIGVAYGSDTRKVEAILREVAMAHPLVVVEPPPSVAFADFGADALIFEIRAILRDVNFLLVTKSEMRHEIARRFAEEGIEIPFAQRDIWLRNPEALTGQRRPPGQEAQAKTEATVAQAPQSAEEARQVLTEQDMASGATPVGEDLPEDGHQSAPDDGPDEGQR